MEHAIGEIITLPQWKKAEVVEHSNCIGCAMLINGCDILRNREVLGECSIKHRTDHKNIIYKEIKEE